VALILDEGKLAERALLLHWARHLRQNACHDHPLADWECRSKGLRKCRRDNKGRLRHCSRGCYRRGCHSKGCCSRGRCSKLCGERWWWWRGCCCCWHCCCWCWCSCWWCCCWHFWERGGWGSGDRGDLGFQLSLGPWAPKVRLCAVEYN